MIDLSHVSDEDITSLFWVIEGLLANQCGCLGGGVAEAENIQIDCLRTLAKGEDNRALVDELKKSAGFTYLDI